MDAFCAINAALSALPYPITQLPIRENVPVCLAFWEVLGQPTAHASDRAQRIAHTMQVDIYARHPIGPELVEVRKALRAAGIRVGSWGPADYEQQTHWHHMPITCYYAEHKEQEEEDHG